MKKNRRNRTSPAALGKSPEPPKPLPRSEACQSVSEAHEATLKAIILAPLSAGKSTLLNALIGEELLPARNEACTSKLFRLENREQGPWLACYSHGKAIAKWQPATTSLLEEFNRLPETGLIELAGPLHSIRTFTTKLVLYDTPGPNNARDPSHGARTRQLLSEGVAGLVVYVLNATQLGIDDDAHLLRQLRNSVGDSRAAPQLVFVLNKADQLDEERGESLAHSTAQARNYLLDLGFPQPIIIPVCASAALQARKLKAGLPLTRKERGELESFIVLHAGKPHQWLDSAFLPCSIKTRSLLRLRTLEGIEPDITYESGPLRYTRRQLEEVIVQSGIRSLELIFEELMLECHLSVPSRKHGKDTF